MKNKEQYKRMSEITSINEAIDNLLHTYKLNDRFDEAALINAWSEVMGQAIANRTGKIFIKKGVLFVEISSAPLKHELNLSKQKIIENFKVYLGKSVVDEIILI